MKNERNRVCVWRGKKRRGEEEGGREGSTINSSAFHQTKCCGTKKIRTLIPEEKERKIVDTGANSTKQCEAITNVAIRVMRLKRDG